jgi:hypothetical protein
MKLLLGLILSANIWAANEIKVTDIDSVTNNPTLKSTTRLESAIKNNNRSIFDEYVRSTRSVKIDGKRIDLGDVKFDERNLDSAIKKLLAIGDGGSTGGGG